MKILNNKTTPISTKGDYSAGRFPGRVFVLIEDIVLIVEEPTGSATITGFMPKEDKLKNAVYHIYLNLGYLKSNPQIDIAFHNVLILAFWRYFSESDTDFDHPLPVSYVIQQADTTEETFVRAKISFET